METKLQNGKNRAARCEDILNCSIQIYDEIHHNYRTLPESLSSWSAVDIQSKISELNALVKRVEQVDSSLSHFFETEPSLMDMFSKLVGKREEKIQQALTTRQSVMEKVKNVKAALRAELLNLSNGQSALTSYKQVNIAHRNLISRSF